MTPIDQAEVFALSLESGLKTVPEVVAWADEQIMQLEMPPYWLLELSLMGKAKGQDVVRLLRQAEGVADESKVLQFYLGILLECIRTDTWSAETCCYSLYRIYERFAESQSMEIQIFRYRYLQLGDENVSFETQHDIDLDFLAFLERESNHEIA